METSSKKLFQSRHTVNIKDVDVGQIKGAVEVAELVKQMRRRNNKVVILLYLNF